MVVVGFGILRLASFASFRALEGMTGSAPFSGVVPSSISQRDTELECPGLDSGSGSGTGCFELLEPTERVMNMNSERSGSKEMVNTSQTRACSVCGEFYGLP